MAKDPGRYARRLRRVAERKANYRNIVAPVGKYTLYFGARPEEIEGEAIEAPSALSVVIARIEVKDKNDPHDVAAAKAVYDGMSLRGTPPSEFSRLDLLSAFHAGVVAEAHRRMDEAFATVPFGEPSSRRARSRAATCRIFFIRPVRRAVGAGPTPSTAPTRRSCSMRRAHR